MDTKIQLRTIYFAKVGVLPLLYNRLLYTKYKENYPICYIIAMNPILVTPKKQYPYSPHADKQTVPRRTAP